jgi:hypothetical protein
MSINRLPYQNNLVADPNSGYRRQAGLRLENHPLAPVRRTIMTGQFAPILAEFSSSQIVALAIVGMGVGFLVLVSLAGIIIPTWASVSKLRMETTLKQQMVERGMSAEEILSILGGPVTAGNVIDHPCASEVVIEGDDEWHPGLILKRDGERYYVHYVGGEMSENEWVPSSRIRFPEPAKKSCGSPWDWTDSSAALGARSWCSDTSKPEPVDQEI